MTTRPVSILVFAATMFAAETPLTAQQQSTGAPADSTAKRSGLKASQAGAPRVVYALAAGGGGVRFDCRDCRDWRGSSAPVLEVSAGLRVSNSILLLASAGGAISTGRIDTDVFWKTLAIRIHARSLGGLYFQPGFGLVSGTMTRDATPPCDDRCQLGAMVTLGLSLLIRTRTDTLGTVANGPVLPLAVGYDMHLRGGVSLTPQLRVMLGQAGVNGFSLGLQKAFGGAGPVWR